MTATWVGFDVEVSVEIRPDLADAFRLRLFEELQHIEGDDPELVALAHDLGGLVARCFDRQFDPFVILADVDDTLDASASGDAYHWFGKSLPCP